jgi:C-terminal processing protease CtpA/Prc
VRIVEAHQKKDGFAAGLRRQDRLVSIDTQSLRYLNADIVAKKMVSPRYSSFTLEYERDYKVEKEAGGKVWNDLGLSLKLEYQGIVVEKVLPDSPAARSGLKANDLVAQVNGQSTRYMPMAKVMEIIRGGGQGSVSLSIRRSVILTRR